MKNEIYLGNKEDIFLIRSILRIYRSVYPKEIFLLKGVLSLEDLLNNYNLIDNELFFSVISSVKEKFYKDYNIPFRGHSLKRFFVTIKSDSIGGFYSKFSLGYSYWFDSIFTPILSEDFSKNKTLRTLELLRCYIHDSLHSSTFKSFKRFSKEEIISNNLKMNIPQIYRYQYGINYRNANGISFSSPKLTEEGPKKINLNLLMDGIVTILTSSMLALYGPNTLNLNSKNENLLFQELIEPLNEETFFLENIKNHHTGVIRPTNNFCSFWGKNIICLIIKSMFSGDTSSLEKFFKEETGIDKAWDILFRSSDF